MFGELFLSGFLDVENADLPIIEPTSKNIILEQIELQTSDGSLSNGHQRVQNLRRRLNNQLNLNEMISQFYTGNIIEEDISRPIGNEYSLVLLIKCQTSQPGIPQDHVIDEIVFGDILDLEMLVL